MTDRPDLEQKPESLRRERLKRLAKYLLRLGIKFVSFVFNKLVYVTMIVAPVAIAGALAVLVNIFSSQATQRDVGSIINSVITILVSFWLMAGYISISRSNKNFRLLAEKLFLLKQHRELFNMIKQDLDEMLGEKTL